MLEGIVRAFDGRRQAVGDVDITQADVVDPDAVSIIALYLAQAFINDRYVTDTHIVDIDAMTLFTVGTLSAALAPTFGLLLAGRVVQATFVDGRLYRSALARFPLDQVPPPLIAEFSDPDDDGTVTPTDPDGPQDPDDELPPAPPQAA